MSAELQPVEIEHVRDHEFVKHGRKRVKYEKCVQCNKAFSNIVHHGYPPSLNAPAAGGSSPFVFDNVKVAWEKRFKELIEFAELPKGLLRVTAEAQIVFPDLRPRDQGNFKFIIEKSLGDALKDGWIANDEFYPEVHYEFGGLTAVYAKDVAALRIMLFPMARPSDPSDSLVAVPD